MPPVDTSARRHPFRWRLFTPSGASAALALLALVPAMLPGDASWVVTFLSMLAFAAVPPILCALRPHWWVNIMVSGALFWVTFLLLGATPGVNRMREGAMVFMLPMMLQPVAAAVSGLVRLVLWRRSRRAALSGGSAPPRDRGRQ